VPQTGNAAERRLPTAQPSLSRQVRDLELEVGVKLLERKARGIALIKAGRVFLDHAGLRYCRSKRPLRQRVAQNNPRNRGLS
jgi:DNA-binding transcriptional LysR family regulator